MLILCLHLSVHENCFPTGSVSICILYQSPQVFFWLQNISVPISLKTYTPLPPPPFLSLDGGSKQWFSGVQCDISFIRKHTVCNKCYHKGSIFSIVSLDDYWYHVRPRVREKMEKVGKIFVYSKLVAKRSLGYFSRWLYLLCRLYIVYNRYMFLYLCTVQLTHISKLVFNFLAHFCTIAVSL